MNSQQHYDREIEDLLKRTFKDDLPPELEDRMRVHLDGLREKMEVPERAYGKRPAILSKHIIPIPAWPWAHLFLRKEIQALASLILIVLGGAIHLSGHHSVLADSVQMMKLSVTISDQVVHARSMECTVHAQAPDGGQSVFTVRWVSPGRTRVDYGGRDRPGQILWIVDGVTTIVGQAKEAPSTGNHNAPPGDSSFRPVEDLLSARDFALHVDKRWQMARRKLEGKDEIGTLSFSAPRDGIFLEMTVNLTTYLPLTLTQLQPGSGNSGSEMKIIKQVTFAWNQPVAPELMVPRSLG